MRRVSTHLLLAGIIVLVSPSTHSDAEPQVLVLPAEADATLVEDAEGLLANGRGDLFVGRTSQSRESRRRALLFFDVSGKLPQDAFVESVELRLHARPSNLGAEIALHRVLESWTEGPSFSGGGGGAAAEDGDATWVHSSYPDEFWKRPGSLFVSRASARQRVEGTGLQVWSDQRHMLEDVRLWQHSPRRNFGWILIGDETAPQTAIVFLNRDSPSQETRPHLFIRYRLVGRL